MSLKTCVLAVPIEREGSIALYNDAQSAETLRGTGERNGLECVEQRII